MIKLSRTEKILSVVPSHEFGPGWSNSLVSVHIADYAANTFRTVYLQPDEQSVELRTLFSIGAAVHNSLLCAVKAKVGKLNMKVNHEPN
jgi:hypothetical protein